MATNYSRSGNGCQLPTTDRLIHELRPWPGRLTQPVRWIVDRGIWAADHELTSQAPWVPLYNPRSLTVLSTRVGNYQYHPYWYLLIDQLWVR